MTVVRDITVHILYTDKVSVKNTMMRKSVHFNNYTEYISHFGNENSAQCATHTHTHPSTAPIIEMN